MDKIQELKILIGDAPVAEQITAAIAYKASEQAHKALQEEVRELKEEVQRLKALVGNVPVAEQITAALHG